jgi:hypothetical protein
MRDMKTLDGRDIPMWEAKASEPISCAYCDADKPKGTRAYAFKKEGQPWIPLCDAHRLPELVDFVYLTSEEPIPGYEPSLLCESIHLLPVISGMHWCVHCTHICYRCGDDKLPMDKRNGIAERVINACPSCDAYQGPGRCTGCRMSSVHLGDPDYSYYHFPMPDWAWDRFIKGTILEKRQHENLYQADLNCADPKEEPMILFRLSPGGKQFSFFDIGNGLVNYLFRWRPVPRFDSSGNVLEPWIYSKGKLGEMRSVMVSMAYMTPDNTSIGLMSLDLDSLDMSDETKRELSEAMREFNQMMEAPPPADPPG